MRTVAVFMFLAAITLCYCWTPQRQDSSGRTNENRGLAKRNGHKDALGSPLRPERHHLRCCERLSPQHPQRKRRHMRAPRAHPIHQRRRCTTNCRGKKPSKFMVPLPLS
ncbi:uncharacterized protein LOC116412198 [Xenopus tropicalis]|uniref:Uncharacterized protein LOC116412198 n=1 Tax=Xenopus tropicalis TaxID=8364 RepID=A0A8J1JV14_XENTR|nr:uncharacterized protein LOC116412198 [Xenopus tropicalis]